MVIYGYGLGSKQPIGQEMAGKIEELGKSGKDMVVGLEIPGYMLDKVLDNREKSDVWLCDDYFKSIVDVCKEYSPNILSLDSTEISIEERKVFPMFRENIQYGERNPYLHALNNTFQKKEKFAAQKLANYQTKEFMIVGMGFLHIEKVLEKLPGGRFIRMPTEDGMDAESRTIYNFRKSLGKSD